MNAYFQEVVQGKFAVVEGVSVCGIVSGRPHESGGPHGLHVYIPVRLVAPGGAIYQTEVIPNEALDGRIDVHEGDRIIAFGQFVYTKRYGFDGLIHDTHPATHRGGANGYILVNGKIYQ
jgi:hypothetical protein